MSTSDTDSADISTDTDDSTKRDISTDTDASTKRVDPIRSVTARSGGRQISIYDQQSICLEELLKPNTNKYFNKVYREEVHKGDKYFSVPMFEHGSESDAQICGLPGAVWSVVNARTKHYNDRHGGENKPKSNEGVIWACLKIDQAKSQVIQFFDGKGKPSSEDIQAVLDTPDPDPDSKETEAEQAEPHTETHFAETQSNVQQPGLQQREPQPEAQQTEPLFLGDCNIDHNTLLDEFDPGSHGQLSDHGQEMVSPMEQDPLMSEDDEKDVVRSFDIALRKRKRKVANARSEVDSLSKRHQKLQQNQKERQRTTEQLNCEIREIIGQIARLQREVEVKKATLLHLQSESADGNVSLQQEMSDIIAKQATAQANLQTQEEDLQKWSQLHSLLHDTLYN